MGSERITPNKSFNIIISDIIIDYEENISAYCFLSPQRRSSWQLSLKAWKRLSTTNVFWCLSNFLQEMSISLAYFNQQQPHQQHQATIYSTLTLPISETSPHNLSTEYILFTFSK